MLEKVTFAFSLLLKMICCIVMTFLDPRYNVVFIVKQGESYDKNMIQS